MRNLTVTRRKSFVGSLCTLKVYIEDATSSELSINGTSCRKLGTLKNGETKTFSIEGGALKVFVIADQLSKNFCNDFYQLEEGEEDLSLIGQNKFSLATGNAFRFDKNGSDEALANRQSGKKKGAILILAAMLIGFVCGFLLTSNGLTSTGMPKTFRNKEIQITLTDEFKKKKFETQTYSFVSKDVAVFCLKENISELYVTSLENYLDLLLDANDISKQNVLRSDGLLGFYYGSPVKNNGKTEIYHYYAYVYETDDAYWLIQFAVRNDLAEEYLPKITEWAKSVKFK